ncbi:hypothetical protein L3D22_04495 [Lysobacter soli]|uniref:hypothetical protein n=1 Tax=Lysobacter soli TaxID=453783 RepID=UPI00209F1718|nr:hypothetical protein [Lysobacter soli]UTA55101.1 hypothetical protein L3D22_04495 [Lysobacter soli]
MAYSFYIERAGSDISLEEWLAAAAGIANLRQRGEGYTAVNAGTGESIELASSPGDLEIGSPQSFIMRIAGRGVNWEPAFFFCGQRARFRPRDIDDRHDPVRKAAAKLAQALGASIVGDEGEQYAW